MRKGVVVAATAAAAGLAIAAFWYRRSARRWKRADRIVRSLREACATPVEKLLEVADAMAAEMRAGLASEGGSSLRMLISPLDSLPTGNEEGLFYGVDLGRTKLQLLFVQLGDKRVCKKEVMEVPVPINLMVGTSEELYDYIALQLAKFISPAQVSSNVPDGRHMEIGVTFSFPVVYNSTSRGTAIEWNRGFSITESAGRDALMMMNEALERHGVNMRISSLVNDTVGTLVGGRYCSSDTVAAVILGNGTNAAYLEHLEAVPKWHVLHTEKKVMVINMEWGNFQSFHLPISEFDFHLDAESPRPGEQIFEKLISGMYLGDIVRRVLLKVAEETALFGDIVPLKLRIPFALRTPDVASMHQDTSEDLGIVGEKLEKSLGIANTTLRMRRLVVEVCDIVVKRGARLAGAGIVGILKKLGRDGSDQRSVVVAEGGLYQHYRLFKSYLHDSVKEILHGKFSDKVVIEHLNDVCGVGAAVLAASSSHHANV